MGTDEDQSDPQLVLHMAPRAAWRAASFDTDREAVYEDVSLGVEGFIHCSTTEQVLIPANERFAGRSDLVLLVIDLRRVPSRTVFEDSYETGHRFPHIYGPIPVSAVIDVIDYPCEPDGSFTLPPELA